MTEVRVGQVWCNDDTTRWKVVGITGGVADLEDQDCRGDRRFGVMALRRGRPELSDWRLIQDCPRDPPPVEVGQVWEYLPTLEHCVVVERDTSIVGSPSWRMRKPDRGTLFMHPERVSVWGFVSPAPKAKTNIYDTKNGTRWICGCGTSRVVLPSESRSAIPCETCDYFFNMATGHVVRPAKKLEDAGYTIKAQLGVPVYGPGELRWACKCGTTNVIHESDVKCACGENFIRTADGGRIHSADGQPCHECKGLPHVHPNEWPTVPSRTCVNMHVHPYGIIARAGQRRSLPDGRTFDLLTRRLCREHWTRALAAPPTTPSRYVSGPTTDRDETLWLLTAAFDRATTDVQRRAIARMMPERGKAGARYWRTFNGDTYISVHDEPDPVWVAERVREVGL
jgi:hypothetical protein